MIGVLVCVLSVLSRLHQLSHFVDEVLICLELIAFVNWFELGFLFPQLRNFMSELLDRALELGFFLREVIHTFCDIDQVSDAFMLLLDFL